jgi:hypothetical protein
VKGYVIGKYEHAVLLHKFMEELKADGHEITCDWTVGLNPAEFVGRMRMDILRQAARADLSGVLNAQFVVVLHHPELCNGLVELGAALADPNKIICMLNGNDPAARRNPLFYWLPEVHHFETFGAIKRFLSQLGKTGWES